MNLHPRIRALLDRLLEKDQKDRLTGISDARVEIQKVLSASDGVLVADVVQAAPQSKLSWIAAAALGVALIAFAAWTLTRPEPAVPLTVSRFLLTPADDAPLASVGGYDFAISPDGTEVVYLGNRPCGGRALYRRSIDGLEAELLPGTEMPADFTNANPFFPRTERRLASAARMLESCAFRSMGDPRSGSLTTRSASSVRRGVPMTRW